jgi:hypothetical protein
MNNQLINQFLHDFFLPASNYYCKQKYDCCRCGIIISMLSIWLMVALQLWGALRSVLKIGYSLYFLSLVCIWGQQHFVLLKFFLHVKMIGSADYFNKIVDHASLKLTNIWQFCDYFISRVHSWAHFLILKHSEECSHLSFSWHCHGWHLRRNASQYTIRDKNIENVIRAVYN